MSIEELLGNAAGFVWGTPLLILLLGGGIFFMIYSRFLPFKYLGHAINVIKGKYDDINDPGEINHFQALSGALAATVGMGNISGVAVAITTGGPGALFWMSVSAFFGIATKFFTCSLAVMYRGKDSEGIFQGGPMYVIREGLGKNWMPLAAFFCIAGFFGATPVFQANQMIQVINDVFLVPNNLLIKNEMITSLFLGLILTFLTGLVIFGGLKRIAEVVSRLVPFMVGIYVTSVVFILILNSEKIIPSVMMVLNDAFTAHAVLGGAVGSIIIAGARRAAFSNEAGIGTAPMMHGAAKTKEPIREGLVAMLGPAIDTLIVCNMTGLSILITDVWQDTAVSGISLTTLAFEAAIPTVGPLILLICVTTFAFTTILGLSYYGRKCLSFMIGSKYGWYFNHWYVSLIIIGSIGSLSAVVSFIDLAFGLMAFPTMISTLILAPKVMEKAKAYMKNL